VNHKHRCRIPSCHRCYDCRCDWPDLEWGVCGECREQPSLAAAERKARSEEVPGPRIECREAESSGGSLDAVPLIGIENPVRVPAAGCGAEVVGGARIPGTTRERKAKEAA